MQKVFSSRQLPIILRFKILQLLHLASCPLWTYICEAWTVKVELRKKIEAFEMWCNRRMLRIHWTDKVPNTQVLNIMRDKPQLIRNIKQRNVAYLGHVLRNDHYQLLQTIMIGKVAGKRNLGRRKIARRRLGDRTDVPVSSRHSIYLPP